MATADEILEALNDYRSQCNGNARLRKMQKDWTKRIHLEAADCPSKFTMVINQGEITDIKTGLDGSPDIVVNADSETFCDIFWGDLNPTSKYLSGELKIKGSQEDIMRLDAISAVIWPEE